MNSRLYQIEDSMTDNSITKVMSREKRFAVINERIAKDERLQHLNVNQFDIIDGWIGVSIGPKHEDRVALRRLRERPEQ